MIEDFEKFEENSRMRKKHASFYIHQNRATLKYSFECLSIQSELFGASSEPYDTYEEANALIEGVINTSQDENSYEKHQDRKGRYYFFLRSNTGSIIFQSRKCDSKLGLTQLIRQFKNQLPEADYEKIESDKKTESKPGNKRYY